MPNFLAEILGIAPAPNSSEQLAQAQARAYSPAMEKRARANGFRSAEEMMLFEQQRSRKRAPQTVRGNSQPSVEAAMAIHPKNIFERILAKWQGAQAD